MLKPVAAMEPAHTSRRAPLMTNYDDGPAVPGENATVKSHN